MQPKLAIIIEWAAPTMHENTEKFNALSVFNSFFISRDDEVVENIYKLATVKVPICVQDWKK